MGPVSTVQRSEGQERFVLEKNSPDLLISCLSSLTVEPGFASLQYVVSGFRLRAEGASARLAVALAEAVSRTFTTVRLKADTTYLSIPL